MTDDDILDSLFHGAALIAFVEQAQIEQGWPSRTPTMLRAYRLYEEFLAESKRNR
jgi:hypothetical protein